MGSKVWLKLWFEMLDDPKVGLLSDRLFRRWIQCLILAGEYDKGGRLPPVPDMAWRLFRDTASMAEILEAELAELTKTGLLAQKDGAYLVSRWSYRQAKAMSNAERADRWRERNRLGHGWDQKERATNGGVTTRSQEGEGEEEKEKEKEGEKEGEGEQDFARLVQAWESSAGPITAMIAEHLKDLADEADHHRRTLPPGSRGADVSGSGWVVNAIHVAAEAATPPIRLSYVRSIVDRWLREGYASPLRTGRKGRVRAGDAGAQWIEEELHGRTN